MSDKIVQAINEVLIETSDETRAHLDPDIIQKMANRVATFLVKGVGNPNPVYDLLVQAHNDGKYPMNTPQGRGDNLRDYTNRMMVMFTTKPEDVGGKKSLTVVQPAQQVTSHKGLSEEHSMPVPPKASEMADV